MNPINIDEAQVEFNNLYNTLVQSGIELAGLAPNEQDTRLKIIDDVLVKILGWDKVKDISTEDHVESGYVDYLVYSAGKNRFVLEAKKVGNELVNIQTNYKDAYSLSGPVLANAQDGIKQAKGYANNESVELACLTNGNQWIIFRGNRIDGKPFGEGKAIVFPSLDSIKNDFVRFYELLSKNNVLLGTYENHLDDAEGSRIMCLPE